MPIILGIIIFFLVIAIFYLSRCLSASHHREIEVMRREAEIKNFMNIYSQTVQNSDDIGRSMMNTARYVADLCEAQAVCIYKVENDNTLRVMGYCGAYPPMTNASLKGFVKPKYILDALRRERIAFGQGLIGAIAASRDPIIIPDATEEPLLRDAQEIVPIQTLMATPLIDDDKVVAVIVAINNKQSSRAFSMEQYHRFRFIAKQVLITLNITQAYASLTEQQRISQELSFARRLQASLLPSKFPMWKGFNIFKTSRPAKEISGDFYDFIKIDKDRLLVVIGDVCGKGIPACIVTSMTRTFIRSYISNFTTLRALIELVNDNLFRDTDDEMYVTLAAALVDSKNNTIELIRCGHLPFIINVRNHNRTLFPEGPGLGLMPTEFTEFDTLQLQFIPGMSVLMFSDGFTEATNERGDELGIPKLGELFAKACAEKTLETFDDQMISFIEAYTGLEDGHQSDDQTFVVIQRPEKNSES